METSQIAESISGNKLYQIRARKVLPILVRQAIAQQPIFYAALAEEIGMPNPRNLNYVLASIGKTLKEISNKWKEEIPALDCLVINKYTLLVGEGVGFISNINNFAKLPKKQKRAIIDLELQKIYAFPRWIEVLNYLGLECKLNPDFSPLLKTITSRNYSAGESPFHEIFKEYVSLNPQILELPKSVGFGEIEKFLPSADVVDVLFTHGNEWIVAEVKSRISDTADIYRGLYQCIKYQAIIEAYQSEKGLQPNCRVALVLEGEFPNELIELKNLLGVEVIDKVTH